MKSIKMDRDFTYRPKAKLNIQYLAGKTYDRVPESAVREIIAAKAGSIVEDAKR